MPPKSGEQIVQTGVHQNAVEKRCELGRIDSDEIKLLTQALA